MFLCSVLTLDTLPARSILQLLRTLANDRQCPDLIHISEDEYSSSRSSTITPIYAPPHPDPKTWNRLGLRDLDPGQIKNPNDEYECAKRCFLEDLGNYTPIGTYVVHHLPEPWFRDKFTGDTWLEPTDPSLIGPKYAVDREIGRIAEALLVWGWIRLFAKLHKDDPNVLIVRVYLLPDDVGRRYIDKCIPNKTMERLMFIKLMQSIDISAEAWTGDSVRPDHQPIRTIKDAQSQGLEDDDSLFYIFNTITSPPSTVSDVKCQYSCEAMSSLLGTTNKLDGLRTDLYPYQKRSAASMIRREVEPARVLDPRLEPFEGPQGAEFYYDQATGVLLRDRRTYEEARGGILAETMGFGKTLICLATVLATKGHWPRVPPEYSVGRHPIRNEVASLAEMAAATIGREQIPWRSFFQNISRTGEHHETVISLLERNIGSYVIPPPPSGRTRQPSIKGQTIRLCAVTLVVVPLNLFTQWQSEMGLHLEPDALKVLSVQALDTPMPSEDDILTCDILLITKQRFEREMKPLEINTAVSEKKIKCICPATTHECNCAAAGPKYRSPLRNLHFLRIIVDEGHDFASSGGSNKAIWALRRLHVDRRWIVSGTPSAGLIGVEVGLAANETLDEPSINNNSADLEHQNKEELRIRDYETQANGKSDKTLQTKASARLQEYKDLQKLGRIVIDFLGLRPWANTRGEDPASWQKYVLPSKDGTRKPRSLRSILESLVVRHRIEDIEKDIQLPALHNKVVYLEPSWHDKLSINLFLLVLTANAVTSERCDQDYMFHSKNRPQLNSLINNLRQSGFYWTSFTPENITKTVEVSQKYLDEQNRELKHESRRREGDIDLLYRAIELGKAAISSPSWTSIAQLHEIGLYVEHFPTEAREAWSLVGSSISEPLLVGASQLVQAQQFVDTRLYASAPEDGLIEAGKAAMECARLKVAGSRHPNEGAQGGNQKRPKGPLPKSSNRYDEELKLLSKHTVSKAKKGGSSSRKRAQQVLSSPKSSLKPSPSEAQSVGSRLKSAFKAPKNRNLKNTLSLDSPLAKTRLCGTASAKLSYLLDKILEVQDEEKSLIFYEGDNIAFYIAQALELVDIRFLIYTGSLTTSRKNAYIHTFNTTDIFRVMLMDIRQAAHGLHVASASRVFFVNPVWQPNVEAQAIKRAHRIGQVRPVFVETLVLKDTLEHQMLLRRKNMTAPEHFRAEKSLLDDPVMNHLIQDAKFIPLTENEAHDPSYQMAPLKCPQQLFGRPSNDIAHSDDADADLIFPDGKDFQVKQRKRQTSSSSTFPPNLSLPPFSRKGREINMRNGGDYLSSIDEHGAGPSSQAASRFSLDGLQDSNSLGNLTSMTRGVPVVGTSHKPRKKVGFTADEKDDDKAPSGINAGSLNTKSPKRSASESAAPCRKRVAFSIAPMAEPEEDHDMPDASSNDPTSSMPARSSSIFGDGSHSFLLSDNHQP